MPMKWTAERRARFEAKKAATKRRGETPTMSRAAQHLTTDELVKRVEETQRAFSEAVTALKARMESW